MSKDHLGALSSSDEMEKLLLIAFGAEGRGVMVQQPTGQMYITRCGFRILSSFFSDPDPETPAQRILMDSARKIHELLGDGVKSFIILTSALLRYSVALEDPVKIARQLDALQMRLSCFQSQCPELPHVDDHILKQQIICFEKLVHTFFSTRFPSTVSSVLAPLLCQWILSNTSSDIYPYCYGNLQNFVRDFSFLCQYKEGGSRSVGESSVECGFRIHRCIFNLPEEGMRRIKIMMLNDATGSGYFDDVDIKNEIDRFIVELECEQKSSRNEKVLLITSAVLTDLTLFRLKCLNVAVLQGVLPDELNFVFGLLFNSEKGTGASVKVETVIDCGEEYTRLNFPNVHQLFLRAPTSELAAEYACTCQSALRMCLVIASHSILPYIVKAGGNFERTLQMRLIQKGEKRIQDPFSCGVRSRAELLAWHKHRYLESDKNFHQEDFMSDLKRLSLSSLDCISICSNTNDILNKICDAFTELDINVVNVIIQALQTFVRKSPQSSNDENCVDSIGLRISILQHSLGATVTLMRICDVLKTKSKLCS